MERIRGWEKAIFADQIGPHVSTTDIQCSAETASVPGQFCPDFGGTGRGAVQCPVHSMRGGLELGKLTAI